MDDCETNAAEHLLCVAIALLGLSVALPGVAFSQQPAVEVAAPAIVDGPQQGDPELADPAETTADATPARTVQLETVSSRVRRQLQQLDALSAEGAWADALELWEEIFAAAGNSNSVIEVSPDRFISLGEHCHSLLAGWPPEALALYRQRIDPIARQQFVQAAANRDASALHEIVRDSFCSSYGDDGLLALGDVALERGNIAAALRHWRKISPLLSDAQGRPLAWALEGIELKQHAGEVLKRLRNKSHAAGVLVYPDSDVPISELLLRFSLASLSAGQIPAAQAYLTLLDAIAPHATGLIAGQESNYSEFLSGLIADAERSSKTIERSEDSLTAIAIGPLVGSLWQQPRKVYRQQAVQFELDMFGRQRVVQKPDATLPPTGAAAHWQRTAILRQGNQVVAVDLLTGEPAITRTGVLHEGTAVATRRAGGARIIIQNGRRRVISTASSSATGPDEAVTIHGNLLYARVNPGDAQSPANDNRNIRRRSIPQPSPLRIIGRDLSRENLTVLDLPPPDAPWQFGGPPVVEGERLYVALTADDVRPRVGVACYSAITGRLLWETSVCSGQPTTGFGSAGVPTQHLLMDAQSLYLNTHLGAIAAVEKRSGSIRWARLYDRKQAGKVAWSSNAASPSPGPTSGLLWGEQLFVAPTDAEELLAFDTATGQTLWNQDRPAGSAQLLAVAQNTLVIGGDQLTGVSTSSGTLRYRWPDSPKSGLRGKGVGCVVGEEVFWPTRDRVFVLDVLTAEQTRPSVDISYLGGGGANLTPAASLLIAAGAKSVTILGPTDRRQSETQPRFSHHVPPLSDWRN